MLSVSVPVDIWDLVLAQQVVCLHLVVLVLVLVLVL
jgi:hypothetical protein